MQISLLDQIDAHEAKLRGMQQALDSANNKDPFWKEKAMIALKEYLRDKPLDFAFRVEDFRRWAEFHKKVSDPPSFRAFGPIIKEAAKGGLVKSVGMGPVTNPKAHGAYANHWIKL